MTITSYSCLIFPPSDSLSTRFARDGDHHRTQEIRMSTNKVRNNDAARNAGVARIDMKLEVIVIPVSDVDRAKEFYARIGWRLDADRAPSAKISAWSSSHRRV